VNPTPTTAEGRVLGRHLDAIEDEKTRTEALRLCLGVLDDVQATFEAGQRAGEELRAAHPGRPDRRGRVVRPEADGLAAVIELLPRRKRAEAPLVVPDDGPQPAG